MAKTRLQVTLTRILIFSGQHTRYASPIQQGKKLHASPSVQPTETTEEMVIALAATSEDAITVLTDSQKACRCYLRGRISKTALRILETKGQLPEIEIV